jgi:hypothetical protein
MKSKNLFMIAVLAAIMGVMSYVFAQSIILRPSAVKAKVEVVKPISKDFDFLNKPYFKSNSINPTKDITIDSNNNTTPLQ